MRRLETPEIKVFYFWSDVISGQDVRDSTTVEEDYQPVSLGTTTNLYGLTVGIPREYHCPGLSQEVLQAWSDVADMLEEGGATVKQVILRLNVRY